MNHEMGLEIAGDIEKKDFFKKYSKCKQLTKPIVNSSLRHKDEIEQLQKRKHQINKNEVLNNPKLTTKLNFGAHEKIFGDLIPININDSLLLPKVKFSIPKKYIHSSNKIPSPDLNDFLDTVASLTYVVTEPQISLESIEYDFDVMLNYKLFTK